MSGPIVPPLEVTEVDGSPDGRPITKLIVSNGDLTISGRTATIDTSGSGGSPATPKDAIQFNSDPAGTFTADAGFVMSVIGGGATTITQTGNILTGGNKIATASTNGSINIICDGTGEIFLQSENDQGGTWTDSIVNIMSNANTDDAQLKFRDSANTDNGSITLDGSGHMILNNNVAAKDIDLKVLTTGQVEVANQTTDTDTVLSIMGNGTGDAKLDLQNASKRVWVVCDENKKLKIQGGTGGNTFILDVSGAATGITFPDGSTQTTAASGGASSLGALTDATTPATDNIGLGSGALDSISATSGNYNTAVGIDAGTALVNGDNNVAIGYLANSTNDTWDNTCVGYKALQNVSTHNITAVGSECLRDLTSGQFNVAVGRNSSAATTTGQRNTSIGYGALQKSLTVSDNVALGYNSLGKGSGAGHEGTGNCGLGNYAGDVITTGSYNICCGFEAGDTITTGSNNVVVGGVDVASATDDDQLSIGSGDGGQAWVTGDSAGSCYQGDNAATWSTTSDQRLKREIVDSVTGLDAINAVQVRNFRYIEKAEPIMETRTDEEGEEREVIGGYEGENHYNLDPEPLRVGVIAQEVQDVFPDAIQENAHGHLTVNTDSINWALLRAVQELSAKVETLEANQ